MKKYYRIVQLFIIIVGLTTSIQAQQHRTLETKVADILAQYPAKSNEHADQLSQKIIDLGPSGVVQFTDMLIPQGQGDDTQTRYALESLAQYCAAPEHNTGRALVEKAFLKAIVRVKNNEVKTFLIRRLNYCATDVSTVLMSSLLSNDKLYAPVIGVLTSIDSEKAGSVLLKAIHHKNAQKEIIKALGVLKYRGALAELTKLAASTDKEIQKEALYTLSKIGAPQSKSILFEAAEKAHFAISNDDATIAYIEYARNLGINGNKGLCKEVCYDIIENTTSENQWHVRSAAYSILRDHFGNEITKALLKEATNTTNKKYRKAIFNEANKGMTSKEIKPWLKVLKKLTNEGKAQLLNSLAHRKEEDVLTKGILPALESKNEALRIEAIKVLAINQNEKAVPVLERLLKNEHSKEELQALYHALQRTINAKDTDVLVANFSTFPKASKKVVLELLRDKRATQHFDFVSKLAAQSNNELQEVAYRTIPSISTAKDVQQLIAMLEVTDKKAYIEKLQTALSFVISKNNNKGSDQLIAAFKSGISKEKLLPIFPVLNSKEGLKLIKDALKSSDIATKKAATNALLLWKSDDVLPYLYDFIREGNGNIEKVFTAYLSKINGSTAPEDQKLLWIRKLTSYAKTNNQTSQLIQTAGKVKTFLSLVFVSNYIDKEVFSQTAMQSAISILLPKPGEKNKFSGDFVRGVVEKIIKGLKGNDSQYIKIDLKEFLSKMPNDEGYVSLFNGKDLSGWEGLVKNPIARAKMSKHALAKAQKTANAQMLRDWFVKDGIIGFKGEGYNNICTIKDYGDFEMLVDWKITNGGDSGIYLRGTPQVQIWDIARTNVGAQVGSGGLYNNQKNEKTPLTVADNPIGEWNTFRIKMVGDRVTVHLNGILVTDNVVLENYWDRKLPIFTKEAIELQAHGEDLGFRNVYVREIHSGDSGLTEEEKKDGFTSLLNGENLDYWIGNKTDYLIEDGVLAVRPKNGGHGNLYTAKEYSDFIFRFEFQLTPGANNGLGIHAPLKGDVAYVGKELQILDNTAPIYKNLKPYQYHGSVYGIIAAKRGALKPIGQWNSQEVIVKGDNIKITLNGTIIVDGNIKEAAKNGTADHQDHPGLKRNKGHIAFLGHGSELQFRKIRIKDLGK
ncbi:DUF1080 domain-containing protein [Flavivirga spongiicola]|uniref:DUF1080 domain-containing protein n=1 Tax=Flavivirga spongiicola TaxID=421621 RepID=A0ABU7XN60_9FLAO|nr:DUF1080 domain-containing protein [Flavivirga sp. MEBiC05379]MDO5981852.1 DUF1080 domain-containing protein [Flavivirga sp. MEBiC05379]